MDSLTYILIAMSAVAFIVFIEAFRTFYKSRRSHLLHERRHPHGILVRDAIDDTQYAKRRTRFTAYKLLRKVRGVKR